MPIAHNQAKARLAKGELALGFGVHHLRGSAVGMLAAAAGYDWLFIDMEHGAMSVQEATQIAIAALSQGVTPIVRCCKDAIFEGTRALDNGAMGVVVPHIDNAEEARAVAAAYRFPPVGTRSWGGPPFAYGMKPPAVADAQRELNESILITCMIETPEAVANAEAIAAVPDEWVDEKSLVGPPARIRERYRAWEAMGVDGLNVRSRQPAAIDIMAEAARLNAPGAA